MSVRRIWRENRRRVWRDTRPHCPSGACLQAFAVLAYPGLGVQQRKRETYERAPAPPPWSAWGRRL
eukprot:6186968-Pleurochrysis_carterae.AAC.10